MQAENFEVGISNKLAKQNWTWQIRLFWVCFHSFPDEEVKDLWLGGLLTLGIDQSSPTSFMKVGDYVRMGWLPLNPPK